MGITPQHVAKIEHFFHRYGGAVVLLARFVEGLRQLNGLVAGTMLMPWQRFLIYNAIGAGLWGVGVYFLGHKLGPLLPHITSHKLWFGIGALIVFALTALAAHYHCRNGHRR